MTTDKPQLDFKYLARAVLSRATTFLPDWLPGGRIDGKEYVCANIRGGEGKSFKVNVASGKWADFAAGDKGGDLISLYAAVHGLSQFQAASQLAKLVGHRLPDPRDEITPPPTRAQVFVKPPKGTPLPNFNHHKFGEPTVRYTYRDESSDILFFICRYEPQGERKQFIPYSYTSDGKWVHKQWLAPRPLYGLQYLTDNKKPILIVEGEKAAEAARQIVQDNYVVLTWTGGSNSFDKADWSPTYGRNILIWPDADEPGRIAATKIATHLLDKCKSVKILNVPDDLLDGYDAHDALTEGYDWDRFKTWAKKHVIIVDDKTLTQKPLDRKLEAETALVPLPTPMPDIKDAPPDYNITVVLDDHAQYFDAPVSESAQVIHARCGLSLTANKQPIMNSDNVLKILMGVDYFKGFCWYDEFHKRIFTRRLRGGPTEQWAEIDSINLMIRLQRDFGMTRISKSSVLDAMISYAYLHTRNEPLEWINSLQWDGTTRLDDFFIRAFGSDDNEYTRAVSKNFWLSLMARILKPGCQVDNMVILEGRQGVFKSSSLRAIGGQFYGQARGDVATKDFYISLQGRFLIEMGELSSMSKSEVNSVKEMLTSPFDEYRPPYERVDEKFPRTCIFVGTTNDKEYLQDVTGARRFWPVRVDIGDMDYITTYRDQFYAEARERIIRGDTWWAMPAGVTEAEQESRRVRDEWESAMATYLVGRSEVTMQEMACQCLNIDIGRVDLLIQRRIGRVMRALKWENKVARRDGILRKVWAKDTDVTLGHVDVDPTQFEISTQISTKRPQVKNYAEFL